MRRRFAFLLSPWATAIGMVLGIWIGLTQKAWVPYVQPVGEVYLSILQMSVIPILAGAIVVSIAKLLSSQQAAEQVRRLLIVLVMMLLVVSVSSICISLVGRGLLDVGTQAQRAIGKLVMEGESRAGGDKSLAIREIDSRQAPEPQRQSSIVSFITDMVPKNVFSAMAADQNLKVIFFFITFGILLKFIKPDTSKSIVVLFEGLFEAFQKLIAGVMYFLPFGMTSLMAAQFSTIGLSIIGSLFRLVLMIYLVAGVILTISVVIIWRRSRRPLSCQLKALGQAMLVCLATRNSFAAIPSSITGLASGLGFPEDSIKLSVPLGVTLCRHGNVMLFSVGAVFAARLYGHPLGLDAILIIVATSVLTGMATSGVPGIVARSMISMVLVPLGLPAGAIVAMLIALDPVIDPISTLVNVYPNCAAAALAADITNVGAAQVERTQSLGSVVAYSPDMDLKG